MYEWILENTDKHDVLYIMIEEPTNMMQARAWSAALQNRLYGNMVSKLKTLVAEQRPVKLYSIFPTTMKKMFTGYGDASKEEVYDSAKDRYKFSSHWNTTIRHTVADATGIAYCCWLIYKSGVKNLPKPVKGVIHL